LFVRVVVPAFENPNAIRVPQQAVQELQGLKTVYVVGPDDKVDARQITANHRLANDWVVESGLKPGERIVVEGTGKLRPGIPVKPVMAGSEGATKPPVASSK
jgi:membrane fusion protein (multidrug efflux system)